MEDGTMGLSLFEMGAMFTLLVLVLFQVKHLLVDFFLQPPYMWMNKGKILHWGGWSHAGLHALASAGIFVLVVPPLPTIEWVRLLLILCLSEVFIHFAIDFLKVRVNQHFDWKCNTSPKFWNLLGVDQFLHQITYIWMTYMWVTQI
jgi:hypothetical protein